jgi:hypothetical protein
MQAMDVEVGLAGGVFKGRGHLLIDTIQQAIQPVALRARIRRTRYEPVVGAALLALESSGVPADEALYRTLDGSLPGLLKYENAEDGPFSDQVRLKNRAIGEGENGG